MVHTMRLGGWQYGEAQFMRAHSGSQFCPLCFTPSPEEDTSLVTEGHHQDRQTPEGTRTAEKVGTAQVAKRIQEGTHCKHLHDPHRRAA